MIIKPLLLYMQLIFILFIAACNNNTPTISNRAIAGISSDIESLNPLFAYSGSESTISELLYLSLVKHEWNDSSGSLRTKPMIAKRWEWNEDSTSVLFYLREDLEWTDGLPVTVNDVVLSFDLYSDPDVQSRFFGSYSNLYIKSNGSIDLEKSFNKVSDHILRVNFVKKATPDLFEVDMPIIPGHIYGALDRKELINKEKEIDPVTNGPFKLKRWDRTQAVHLIADTSSFLTNSGGIEELIFKIVPDYNSRLTQLKTGEIDLMEDIKTGDIKIVKEKDYLEISAVKGREYDFIGWNNTDKSSNKPHLLFGNSKIRRALTKAINRREILEGYMDNQGELASGPVAPIFKEAFHQGLKPLEYNPTEAKKMLREEGWMDLDKNGIIEKNGVEFSFTMFVPSGNPRREAASAIVKNNLYAAGVEVKIENIELGVLVEKLFNKEADAWMLGWVISIPLDLQPYWNSDKEKYPLNFSSYSNPSADKILKKIEEENKITDKNYLYKEFQEMIYNDQPVTFLYWVDNIVGYSKRIKNIDINPLGPFNECWNWVVK